MASREGVKALVSRGFLLVLGGLISFALLVSCEYFSKGELSLRVSWPEATLTDGGVTATLTLPGEEPQQHLLQASGLNGAAIELEGVKAGSYTILIELADSGVVFWETTGTAIVEPGLRAKAYFELDEAEFTGKPVFPPVFSIDPSTIYQNPVSVTLSSHTPLAQIYYTVDGSLPDPNNLEASIPYSGDSLALPALAFDDAGDGRVYAIAVREGWEPSVAVSFDFKRIESPSVANLNQGAGTLFALSVELQVTTADPSHSVISAFGGGDPDVASLAAGSGIVLEYNAPGIFKTASVLEGRLPSLPVSLEVKRQETPSISAPAFSVNPGEFDFTLSSADDDVPDGIYYQTDSTDPSAASASGVSPLTLTLAVADPAFTEIRAVAVKAGFIQSPVVNFINAPAESPLISDARSTNLHRVLSIAMSSATPGASIYYTTDGSDPTDASSLYLAAFDLVDTGVTEVRAIAISGDRLPSAVASQPIASHAAVDLDLSAGERNRITMSDLSASAQRIYYTLNGNDPQTEGSPLLYSTPFRLAQNVSDPATVTARLCSALTHSSPAVALVLTPRLTTPAAVDSRVPESGGLNLFSPLTVQFTVPGGENYYYSTDGSSPFSAITPTLYDGGLPQQIALTTGQTLKVIATSAGTLTSSDYTHTAATVDLPVIALNANDQAEITAPANAQTVYYKIGGTPAYGDPGNVVYAGAFAVSQGDVIEAVGVATMLAPSAAASFAVGAPVTTPVIADNRDPADLRNRLTVSITSSDADSIYYTLDGTPAGTGSNPYSVPFEVDASAGATTVKAKGYASGQLSSAEGSASFDLLSPPLFTIDGDGNGVLSEDGLPAGQKIYYTLDGSSPHNAGSILYSAPFAVSTGTVIKAVSAYADKISSTIATITPPQSAAPVIADARAGDYKSPLSVTITSPGTVYYTTDGSNPLTSPTKVLYVTALTAELTGVSQLKAVALEVGKLASDEASQSFTTLSAPSAALDSDITDAWKPKVTLSGAVGSSFYYLAGNPPAGTLAVNGILFTLPFVVTDPVSIEAVAGAEFSHSSTVTTGSWSGACSDPVIDTPSGAVAAGTAVTISVGDGSSIYYSIDDGASWNAYGSPVVISTAVTLRARCRAPGKFPSAEVSEAYTIAP